MRVPGGAESAKQCDKVLSCCSADQRSRPCHVARVARGGQPRHSHKASCEFLAGYDAFATIDLGTYDWYLRPYQLCACPDLRLEPGDFTLQQQHMRPIPWEEMQVWPKRRTMGGESGRQRGRGGGRSRAASTGRARAKAGGRGRGRPGSGSNDGADTEPPVPFHIDGGGNLDNMSAEAPLEDQSGEEYLDSDIEDGSHDILEDRPWRNGTHTHTQNKLSRSIVVIRGAHGNTLVC